MKIQNILLLPICLLLISCGEDRRKEYAFRTEPNKWIESQMLEYYYWYDNIVTGNLNYYARPEVFFPTLLTSDDRSKQLSIIEPINSPEKPPTGTYNNSYGLEFRMLNAPDSRTEYYVRVLRVAENSPAYEAGLKRGDWIIGIDGVPVTSVYRSVLHNEGTKELSLTLGTYDEEGNMVPLPEAVVMAAPRVVVENAICCTETFTTTSGQRVGYLALNHLASGPTEEDDSYIRRLAEISNEFKANNISEFILDLRYNAGGSLKTAQFLSTMIVPENALGNEMYIKKFNDKNSDKDEVISLTQENLMGGANLNLQKVYFLMGDSTAAESELIYNSVSPYFETSNLISIGGKSRGKNVGVMKISSDENYPWVIYPVVCVYNNSAGDSYAQGITPTYSFNEMEIEENEVMYELGDERELLLKTAIAHIEGRYPEEPEPETRRGK